jgi:hypothetical protein
MNRSASYLKQYQSVDREAQGDRVSSWLNDVISNDLIAMYEGHYFPEDALLWLREKPRTFGELRTEEIDWLRWMAANTEDKEVLENLSQDPDTDVRMWVACNPMTPRLVLDKLAGDPVVFVRRGVAQNSSIPAHLRIRLNDDPDIQVRALAFKNAAQSR